MAVTQISKIQLRTGPQTDLPGSPSSLSPLTFRPGLDLAEVAMASDTGRVFIGHNPTIGQPNYNRATFPYKNIEILTENATDTFSAMFGNINREAGAESFYVASLLVTSTAYYVIADPRNTSIPFKISFTDGASFEMEYTIFDMTNKPVRIGTARVMQFETGEQPSYTDDFATARRIVTTADGTYNPLINFNPVTFRFTVNGPVGGRYITIDYTNNTTAALQIAFRITRPRV